MGAECGAGGLYETIRRLIQLPDALFTQELGGSGEGGADTVDKATKAHYLDLSTGSVRLRRSWIYLSATPSFHPS